MSAIDQYPISSADEIAISWSANQATSDSANIQGLRLIGIAIPSVFVGSSVSFLIKVGSSYLPMYVDATLYSVVAAVDRFVVVRIPFFAAASEIKIVSASSEAIATEITLVVRPV